MPNCTKSFEQISPGVILTTETWNDMERPWTQGNTIIAKPGYRWVTKWEAGENYTINKIYDDKGNLVALYCDIGSPLKETPVGLEFDDWYLDVWQPVGSKPEILDEEELGAAVKAGYLTDKEATVARNAANQLVEELAKNT